MTPILPKLTSKLSLFISCRSIEAPFGVALKAHLVADFLGMVDVFLSSDTTSILAGDEWFDTIVERLNRSDFHIVICNVASAKCEWINFEAGGAALKGTRTFPLCHSGTRPDQLPVPLGLREGGVFTDTASFERLYFRLAGLIGCGVPRIDFAAYAREFREVEQEFRDLLGRHNTAAERAIVDAESVIPRRPRVICATSPQFKEIGYANQLELVLQAFPDTVRHEIILNSQDLKRVLLSEQVDIVHITAFVCPIQGTIYFTPVELPGGRSTVSAGEADTMAADTLVSLLIQAKTRLVVVGASASLALGARLLEVTNVIAVKDMVTAKAMANWVDTFYKALLKDNHLQSAFKLATDVSQAPMAIFGRQRQFPDLMLSAEGEPTTAAPLTS
jgi:hypothetical protein